MKLFCQACKGKKFYTEWTKEPYYKPVFLGEVMGSFVYKPAHRCKVCKVQSIFVKDIKIAIEPKKGEHIVYL